MAGSLIKIDEFTTTSAVASVTIGGGSSGSSNLNASIDSTYDVYMLQITNVRTQADARALRLRFTASGTANTTSNYDRAMLNLRSDTTFTENHNTNQTYIELEQGGTGTSEFQNATFYLFNFNNASQYSFITNENSGRNASGTLSGKQGGGVLTVTEFNDGVNFLTSGGNINTGSTFTLYGLKK